jgi:quinol monooxygenase YgiN
MIHLTGRLICATTADAAIVSAHLPDHITLSRQEPGCLWFRVTVTADPLVWALDEGFVDDGAVAAHQSRTRASVWGEVTKHIPRDFALSKQP